MSNILLTPSIIAKEALAILRNTLVMADLVHTDYSNEFVKVGDTITVRKPATLVANDFDGSITRQDILEQGIPVKMDRFKDVSVALGSKEQTLELRDFSKQVIEPAMVAIAQQIDEDLANFAFGAAANKIAIASATPTNLADIAMTAKTLDNQKALLTDRHLVLSPEHKYRYALTENLSKVSYAGTNETLREALLGRIYTMNTYMDQNVPQSAAPVSGTAVGTFKVESASNGKVKLTDVSPATGTVKIGDGFVYLGRKYVFTEDGTATAGTITSIEVSPDFPAGVTTAVEVGVVRGASSLAFHRDAIAMVTRPLDLPMGAARAAVASGEGISVRVVYGYDQDLKKDTISFDLIYGIAELRPEHIIRLVDAF